MSIKCNVPLKHSRRLLCIDGTHVRTVMKDTLLIATVKDANSHSVLLAVMYCPSEDRRHWSIFIQQLKCHFPGISVVMSDKDKGGEAAIKS